MRLDGSRQETLVSVIIGNDRPGNDICLSNVSSIVRARYSSVLLDTFHSFVVTNHLRAVYTGALDTGL